VTGKLRSPRLSIEDIGINLPSSGAPADSSSIDVLPETDPVIAAVKNALLDGYAGVILRGPPGTSKSWYAARIAGMIAGEGRAVFVQFHPSYQYEDFIEAWVPNKSGGFELKPKIFLQLCASAHAEPEQVFVLVIDEISRTDAARVFGEALTYLEMSKRNMPFQLSSGTPAVVPANIVILGTMNPWDRGVDEMDVALLRRFAQVDMSPDPEILEEMLTANGVSRVLIDGLLQFFNALGRASNKMLHVGHAYFSHVHDAASLERVWEFQLRHHFQSACRLEPDELRKIEGMWSGMVGPGIRSLQSPVGEDSSAEHGPQGATPVAED